MEDLNDPICICGHYADEHDADGECKVGDCDCFEWEEADE